jgi:hypothetical protein
MSSFTRSVFQIKLTSPKPSGTVSKSSDIFICTATLFSPNAFNSASKKLRIAHYSLNKSQFIQASYDNGIVVNEIRFDVVLKASNVSKFMGYWSSLQPPYAALSDYLFYSDLWSIFFYALGQEFYVVSENAEY